MKLSLNRSHFLKVLQHCSTIIERRTTVPILSNVLIETVGDNAVRFTATDLEISLVETIPAAVEVGGKTTVSGRMLHDVVRKLPGEAEIFLSLNDAGTRLIVESDKSHFELAILSPEDYPSVAIAELPHQFKLPTKMLLSLFGRTAFSMSTEETRYYLNGIFLHATETGELRAVATDGHRMARMQGPLPKGAEQIPGVIISRKTINQIQEMMSEGEQEVEIGLSSTQLSVKLSNAYLISRLIDGTFPEYERVIPQNTDKLIKFDPAHLAIVVDRVATMSSDKTHGVKLRVQDGKITFTADGNEMGTADEEMLVDYDATPVNLGFNAKYLLEIAQSIKETGAEMALRDEESPVIIQASEEKDALYVLMPMRI
jgi:DNA polymerase-3 subunit beta